MTAAADVPGLTRNVRPELRTTVCLQNLPLAYTREMLLGLFDNYGFSGMYDFVFLPIDATAQKNLGYAVVNLVSPLVAAQFWDTFSGFTRWWRSWCKEICVVSWSTFGQGLDENISMYRHSPIMHHAVHDQFKPAVFCKGERIPFPLSTRQSPKPDTEDPPTPKMKGPPFPSSFGDSDNETRTTVLLSNLPRSYNRDKFLALVDSHGFSAEYDFVYLPIDFKTDENRGYAFINFSNSPVGEKFLEFFNGFTAWPDEPECGLVCEARWSEFLQGLEEHIARYRNSPTMHENVRDEHKPVYFVNGARQPFPAPTKRIRAPRNRTHPGKHGGAQDDS
eukprot:TRINITY_DN58808_c0_g4_i3.p1 TRINITY_DN58808_c0_g4~~TRINITY_DN58808_c0_g4_i3.p1  ORF type:complete len:334 (-),score=27.69 TRINITY_DN58808_c0_g4_i3:360-1361(-)